MLEEAVAAPELMLTETTNVLRKLEASRHISTTEANGAHRDLLRMRAQIFPFQPLAERVWTLRGQISSYDATYIALAESLDTSLATLDRKLAKGARDYCSFILPPA